MIRIRPSTKKPRTYSKSIQPGRFVKLDARVENVGVQAVTFWVGGWRIAIRHEDLAEWVK